MAYVRANNVNIPQGAANIRIFSKEGLPNDGSSCRVFMSGSSDPGSSAPSTSKISYESSSCGKRATSEEVTWEKTNSVRRLRGGEEQSRKPQVSHSSAKILEPEKSKRSEVGKNQTEEEKEKKGDIDDEAEDRQSVLQDTFEDFKEESNHEFLSELEKVQEAIDSFDKDVEFHDEFQLQSPSSGRRSEDRDSERSGEFAELTALVSSDDDSVKALSPQPKGDIFFTDSKSLADDKRSFSTKVFFSESVPQKYKEGENKSSSFRNETSERLQNDAFDELFKKSISPDKLGKGDSTERKGKEQSSSQNVQEEGRVRKGQKRSSDGCEKHVNREKGDFEVKRELRTRPGEVVEVKRELRERSHDQVKVKKEPKGKPKESVEVKRELRERQALPSVTVSPREGKGKDQRKLTEKHGLKNLKAREKGDGKRGSKEKLSISSPEKENVKKKFLKPPSLVSKSSSEKVPALKPAKSLTVSDSPPTPKISKKALVTLNSKDATSLPPSPPSCPVPRKGVARVVVQPEHQAGRKDFLQNLDMRVTEGEPYLAVSTFSNLFTGFSLDTGRLLPCLEHLGPPRQHLLFDGWTVTHLSFPAARKLLQLAGAPRFLVDFLNTMKPRKSYIDLSEYRRAEYAREEKDYFRKTDLADCDTAEFKELFGLVTHEEASTIREKAKISKRRMLRAKSDLHKNRSGPEDTHKFLQVKPTFLQLQARKRIQQEEPIVSGDLVAHLATIGQETLLPPLKAPRVTPSSSNCDKKSSLTVPVLNINPTTINEAKANTVNHAAILKGKPLASNKEGSTVTKQPTHCESTPMSTPGSAGNVWAPSSALDAGLLDSHTCSPQATDSHALSTRPSDEKDIRKGPCPSFTTEENSEESTSMQTKETSADVESERSNRTVSPVPDCQKKEGEKFTVTQTREMKRKGIQLPRGWLVQGTRKEWETVSQGQVYTYHRIDWSFQAPDGRHHRSLRSALATVRQQARQARLAKWQLQPGPDHGKGEVGKEYLAMAREEERRFEKDVYSIAGIRPVRKFPGTGEEKMPIEPIQEDQFVPKRMSAVKRNPLSPTECASTRETTNSRRGGFSLSQVGEIQGPGGGGWFTSKLECLRKLVIPSNHLTYSSLSSSLKITIFRESERTRGLDIEEYRQQLVAQREGGMRQDEHEEVHGGGNSVDFEEESEAVQKRMRRNLLLPPGWQQRLVIVEDEERKEWVDPQGRRFRSLELVLSHLELGLENDGSLVEKPEESQDEDQIDSHEEEDVDSDLSKSNLVAPFKSKKIALRKRGKSRSGSGEDSGSNPQEAKGITDSTFTESIPKRESCEDSFKFDSITKRMVSEDQHNTDRTIRQGRNSNAEQPKSDRTIQRRKSKEVMNSESPPPSRNVSNGDKKIDFERLLIESRTKSTPLASKSMKKEASGQKDKKGITDEKIRELLLGDTENKEDKILEEKDGEETASKTSEETTKTFPPRSGKGPTRKRLLNALPDKKDDCIVGANAAGEGTVEGHQKKRPKLKRPTFSDIFPDLPTTASSLPPMTRLCRTSSPADSVEDLLGDSEEDNKEGKRTNKRKDKGRREENKIAIKDGRRGRGSRRTSYD